MLEGRLARVGAAMAVAAERTARALARVRGEGAPALAERPGAGKRSGVRACRACRETTGSRPQSSLDARRARHLAGRAIALTREVPSARLFNAPTGDGARKTAGSKPSRPDRAKAARAGDGPSTWRPPLFSPYLTRVIPGPGPAQSGTRRPDLVPPRSAYPCPLSSPSVS